MISKAAYLVECAHFVRRCSLGQWPEWMRINMTTFRPQESFAVRTTGNMNARMTKLYQAAAARMFYIWGEVSHCHSQHSPGERAREHLSDATLTYLFKSKALSSQLEAILDDEQKQLNLDNSNDAGGGAGGAGGAGATSSWNNDESYEDYYNEGTCVWCSVYCTSLSSFALSVCLSVYVRVYLNEVEP